MTIVVREGDPDAFFEVPFAIHPRTVGYVSPMRGDLKAMLDPRRNPILRDGAHAHWTAWRDGRPVGRVMALEHAASNRLHGTRRLQFGFLDVVDDVEAARALLSRVEDMAAALGMDEVAGPFDMTAMQQMGVVTSGFEHRAYTDMAMNPRYLPALLESCGYERFFPMTTFEIDVATARTVDDSILREEGMRLEPISRSNFRERMEQSRIILNDGFEHNPFFVPLTSEEFAFQAGSMMAIIDSRLSSVLTRDGRPVATIVCIPDLSDFMVATRSRIGISTPLHYLRHRMNRDRAVIIFYSVVGEEQGRGIIGAMLSNLVTVLRGTGYRTVGGTWIGSDNVASLRQVEKFGGRRLHGLHMFRRPIR